MRARIVAVGMALLMASLMPISPIFAQQEAQGSQLNGALGGLQQAADAIAAAQQATTPAAKRQQAQTAIGVLEGVRTTLQAVLTQPPDDFVRSRAEAVLDQLDEGLADLREGVAGPDAALDAKLEEARAQILEAIAELRPAIGVPAPAPAVSRPVTMPVTGEPAAPLASWAALALLSLSCIGVGLKLRAR